MNDIMNFIFLRLLYYFSSTKKEDGKIDILNNYFVLGKCGFFMVLFYHP